jgi:multidrug efflux pump subunit AcrB
MLLITVLPLGQLRQTVAIWTIVPMAVNGVALGLPATGLHLPLMAPLGLLSPSGTLIENTIVPVKEIDPQAGCGIERREAILDASVSRLRPVMRAAVAAILGKASAPPRPSRSWRASASRRS